MYLLKKGLHFLLLMFPLVANADLQYCNRTTIDLFSAVGEYVNGDYISTGWFLLTPNRCRIVLQKRLDHDEYWVFAVNDEKNYKTDGDEDFCVVGGKAFDKLNRDKCNDTGHRSEEFATIYVGYNEHYRVDFLGGENDTSASVSATRSLDTDSGSGDGTVGGGSCTQSTIEMCGDPSGHVYATWTVPNLSDAQVYSDLRDQLNYSGFLGVPNDDLQELVWTLRYLQGR